jgi:hypothetical protein
LSLLDLTALTTLSQRWNTYVWLAGVGVAVILVVLAVVLVDFYLPQDIQ